MRKLVDFSKLDFKKTLETYNIKNLRQRGNELSFSCPFPEHERGDKRPSSNINLESGTWNCFGCKRKGTIINFVAELENITIVEAINKLKRTYVEDEEGFSCRQYLEDILKRQEEKKIVVHKTTRLPEELIQLFEVDWFKAKEAFDKNELPLSLRYPFSSKNLSPEILTKFQIGFDKHSRRITIPLRDSDGNLVGFKGRATTPFEEIKYLGIGDKGDNIHYGFPTCKTSNYVFGIDKAGLHGIIVEGEFDAISLYDKGIKGVVALGGSNASDYQLSQIIDKFDKVTLLFDPDKAGRKAEKYLARNLEKRIRVKIGRLEETDPADTPKVKLNKALELASSSLLWR